MGSLIELLANKKRASPPTSESVVVLPVMHKEHEGACGPNCECGGNEESGCCGG